MNECSKQMYDMLGMSAADYVARGLAVKRVVEGGHSFDGTEVGVGGAAPMGSVTSPISLPTTESKRCTWESREGLTVHDDGTYRHESWPCPEHKSHFSTTKKSKKEPR